MQTSSCKRQLLPLFDWCLAALSPSSYEQCSVPNMRLACCAEFYTFPQRVQVPKCWWLGILKPHYLGNWTLRVMDAAFSSAEGRHTSITCLQARDFPFIPSARLRYLRRQYLPQDQEVMWCRGLFQRFSRYASRTVSPFQHVPTLSFGIMLLETPSKTGES